MKEGRGVSRDEVGVCEVRGVSRDEVGVCEVRGGERRGGSGLWWCVVGVYGGGGVELTSCVEMLVWRSTSTS